jgi:hypothetical protein
LTGGVVAAAGVFEAAYGFFIDTVDFLKHCWRTLLIALLVFAAYGAATYGFLSLVRPAATLQFGGRAAGPGALVLAAVVAAQALRVQGPRKAEIVGSPPSLSDDRESYYARAIRMARCAFYRSLVTHMARDERLSALVLCGLLSAYPLEVVREKFQVWLDRRQPPADHDALTIFLSETANSKKRTERSRAEILLRRLIQEDIGYAVHLAKSRATAIIDQHALA